jgi:hypothetical protein
MAHVAVWDPFWFMREMFRWASASAAASFHVAEKADSYVYKAKLTLPDRVDAEHVKAALDNGELTLVVPKAAAITPAPDAQLTLPDQVDADQVKAALDNGESTPVVPKAAVTPAPVPAPAKKRRTTESGRPSAARKPRRGARSPSRRG